MLNRQKLGAYGEGVALQYLEGKHYKILAKNFKCRWGEIDIVARNKGKIIFFEVKTIQKKEGFVPEDKLNPKKKRQLLKMVQIYLSEKKIPFETPLQIDVLAVELEPFSQKTRIRHFKNVIEDTY